VSETSIILLGITLEDTTNLTTAGFTFILMGLGLQEKNKVAAIRDAKINLPVFID